MGVSQIVPSNQEGELTTSTEWVEFDEADGVYRTAYDPAIDNTSLAVVSAVATVSGTNPVDLDSLHATIDTTALDRLFQPENQSRNCRTTFRYCELDITVDATRTIELKRR